MLQKLKDHLAEAILLFVIFILFITAHPITGFYGGVVFMLAGSFGITHLIVFLLAYIIAFKVFRSKKPYVKVSIFLLLIPLIVVNRRLPSLFDYGEVGILSVKVIQPLSLDKLQRVNFFELNKHNISLKPSPFHTYRLEGGFGGPLGFHSPKSFLQKSKKFQSIVSVNRNAFEKHYVKEARTDWNKEDHGTWLGPSLFVEYSILEMRNSFELRYNLRDPFGGHVKCTIYYPDSYRLKEIKKLKYNELFNPIYWPYAFEIILSTNLINRALRSIYYVRPPVDAILDELQHRHHYPYPAPE